MENTKSANVNVVRNSATNNNSKNGAKTMYKITSIRFVKAQLSNVMFQLKDATITGELRQQLQLKQETLFQAVRLLQAVKANPTEQTVSAFVNFASSYGIATARTSGKDASTLDLDGIRDNIKRFGIRSGALFGKVAKQHIDSTGVRKPVQVSDGKPSRRLFAKADHSFNEWLASPTSEQLNKLSHKLTAPAAYNDTGKQCDARNYATIASKAEQNLSAANTLWKLASDCTDYEQAKKYIRQAKAKLTRAEKLSKLANTVKLASDKAIADRLAEHLRNTGALAAAIEKQAKLMQDSKAYTSSKRDGTTFVAHVQMNRQLIDRQGKVNQLARYMAN